MGKHRPFYRILWIKINFFQTRTILPPQKVRGMAPKKRFSELSAYMSTIKFHETHKISAAKSDSNRLEIRENIIVYQYVRK